MARSRSALTIAGVLFLITALWLVMAALLNKNPKTAQAGFGMIVNSTADTNSLDDYLTLQEAILVARGSLTSGFSDIEKTLLANGGCTFITTPGVIDPGSCGSGVADTIIFTDTLGTINLTSPLPTLSDDDDNIFGVNGAPTINGASVSSGNLFTVDAPGITIAHLSILNGVENASTILIDSQSIGVEIRNNYIGVLPTSTACSSGSGVTRQAQRGIDVASNSNGSFFTDVAYITNNVIGCHYAGVYIYDSNHTSVGVKFDGSEGGNSIGMSLSGSALPNSNYGVYVAETEYTTIAYNIISGNTHNGLYLFNVDETDVDDNIIGLTPAGDAMPNGDHGIFVSHAENNRIGDNVANFISNNGQNGIYLHTTLSDTISHNFIGINQYYDLRPNGQDGVNLYNTGYGKIYDNIIGGNNRHGIYMELSHENMIYSNTIGYIQGGYAIPNGGDGVVISNYSYSITLGSYPPTLQLIAGNSGRGVYIENSKDNLIRFDNIIGRNGGEGVTVDGIAASSNWIQAAVIMQNGGLPIDLGGDGHTPNDIGDGDIGPNNFLNYPVITGTVGSVVYGYACNDCTVTVYHALGNPASAGGGGESPQFVNCDSNGHWSFDLTPTGWDVTEITMVATSPTEGSSEMSPRPVVYLPLIMRQ